MSFFFFFCRGLLIKRRRFSYCLSNCLSVYIVVDNRIKLFSKNISSEALENRKKNSQFFLTYFKTFRITKTSSSPSLMPLLTNSRMSKYKASQLLNFSQLEKELKWSTTTAAELSTISSNSSSQKLLR